MTGNERIKTMLDEWMEKNPNDLAFKQIVENLLEREDLDNKLLNEEKNLKDLYEYIRFRAEKHKNSNWCFITDNIVYIWAVMYFTLSNDLLKFKKENKKTKKSTNSLNTKTEEKSNVISLDEARKKKEENEMQQISMFGGAV